MKKFLISDRFQQYIYAGIAFSLAALALFNPFFETSRIEDIGGFLVWAAVLIFIQGFKRATVKERSSAHISALISFLLGLLLINAKLFDENALYLFASMLFGIDFLRQGITLHSNRKEKKPFIANLFSFLANLGILFTLFLFEGRAQLWILAITGGLRIIGMGFEILSAKLGAMDQVSEDIMVSLGLNEHPEIAAIAENIEQEEVKRAKIDRHWIITFLLILFFIHLGRMGFDRSAYGILSPLVALLGDMVIALIFAFLIIIPFFSGVSKLFRPFEKRTWLWVMKTPVNERHKFHPKSLIQSRLEARTRRYIRIRKAGYSFKTALRTGLQMGLPFAALLAAIIPVFGMSWYFDTENWASGIWDSWAAKRTDIWRTEMVQAVESNPNGTSFQINPPGVTDANDFSFLIIGDPGEGDASQYILHDQIVGNASKDLVKFVVISSDVVYPDGAMKDYEKNFWLPMKGVNKPVYALPGNHDWYDALEGFAATFFDSTSARLAMHARRNADLNLTSAGSEKVSAQIKEAARLRSEYAVPTGFQKAPYFQLQTKDFAFITIETGIGRRIDDVQMNWLKKALATAKGKFIFVLLGHPFYAIGEYQGNMNPDFEKLHSLLKEAGATITMAGDTHDLEYYVEPPINNTKGKNMYHFVNGGGGAYLSLGAALLPREEMVQKIWAHYPATAPIIKKIESNISIVKQPAWYWTKSHNGWPFSAEWLSAAFDYNKAPFFQSFVEVKVEPSRNTVTVVAYGPNGPLKWSDMEYSEGAKPANVPNTALVEWEFNLK
jgi:3',5'-cyclic AMP phosphodiesterase CpdA